MFLKRLGISFLVLIWCGTLRAEPLILAWPEAKDTRSHFQFRIDPLAESAEVELVGEFDDGAGRSYALRLATGRLLMLPFRPSVVRFDSTFDERLQRRIANRSFRDLRQRRTDPGHFFQIGHRIVYINSSGGIVFLPVPGEAVLALNHKVLGHQVALVAYQTIDGAIHSYVLVGSHHVKAFEAPPYGLKTAVQSYVYGHRKSWFELTPKEKELVGHLSLSDRYGVMMFDEAFFVPVRDEYQALRPELTDRERLLETEFARVSITYNALKDAQVRQLLTTFSADVRSPRPLPRAARGGSCEPGLLSPGAS